MGYPTSDEIGNPDGQGTHQEFEGAALYWNILAGVNAIGGAIRDKWEDLGGSGGSLGDPTSDEIGTPDGIGRYNSFQGGMIYWTPLTDAHPVQGAILDEWASSGYESGIYGYPIEDSAQFDRGISQSFEFDDIFWFFRDPVKPVAGDYEYSFNELNVTYIDSDNNGTFTGQMSGYGSANPQWRMAWSFKLSPYLMSISSGLQSCKAGLMKDGQPTGYWDEHPNIPIDYTWHSSIQGIDKGPSYMLGGYCTFPVVVAGKAGKAVVKVRFAFSRESIKD